MADTRSQEAIDRIERALLRIEATARAAPPAAGNESAGFAQLSARHNALRAEADGALSALNALIAAEQGRG